jgi:sarcosine oxidase subunit alpha
MSIGRKLGGKEIKLYVPEVLQKSENAVEPFWFMPKQAKRKLRNKTFLDFQNDVKITDVELAARGVLKV